MKQVIAFGQGGVATVLKEYCERKTSIQWQLTLMDQLPADETARKELIRSADLVIVLNSDQHHLIADECIACGTHLVTPARLNERIMNLRARVESNNLLFLYEMGFDPGLDHINAMHCIHALRSQGANIISMHAHSGRLVAPGNDHNPWHHTTNDPRREIQEGKEGAVYKENGIIARLPYEKVFDGSRLAEFPELGMLGWYPVTDSLGYIPLYDLHDVQTFVRTTLRHHDFMYGWKNVVDLKLTADAPHYDTEGKSLADFFRVHFDKHGFSGWLEKKMMDRFTQTKEILEKLMQFMEVQQEAAEGSAESAANLLMVDEKGKLENIDLEDVKDKAAAMVAYKMHEANLTLKQLFFLGMDDEETRIAQNNLTPAQVLQLALEQKMSYKAGEQDMAAMMHELEYELNGQRAQLISSLLIKGNQAHSACDVITGTMLGITAQLVISGQIGLKGLHIPLSHQIYQPVLDELRDNGIIFETLYKAL